MRRLLWTVGLGLGGFLIGGKGGGWWGALIGTMWSASIGFGFGSIFSQKSPSKLLIAYWGATLALLGIFFGLLIGAGLQPEDSTFNEIVHSVIGIVIGSACGVLVGMGQLRALRRRSQGAQ